MGVALCHFALAAEESGLNPQFRISGPGIAAEPDTEYIASYLKNTGKTGRSNNLSGLACDNI